MAAPEYSTWVGDPDNGINPARPAVADLGGSDKQNDAQYPPLPGDPDATEWNQAMMQIAALGALAPAAIIDLRFSGGAPSIFAVYAPNTELVAEDFEITDVGTGVVTLECPATKLPDVRFGMAFPQANGNHTANAFRSAAQTLRVEVRTAGVAADVNVLAIWG